jgi:hypothetical protein
MKRLLKVSTWVVVALVIVGGITLVARQQQTASEKYERDRESRCVATFPIASEAEKQDACKHEKDSGKNYLQWWYVLFAWPEGITTWAIIATGVVIGWQSFQTKKAAQAALLNAQAVINSERPWIMVTVEEVVGPSGGFNLYMTNKGRTPAMVTGAYIGCVVVKDLSALPNKAPYGPGSMAKDRIVLAGEKLPITWFDGSTLKKIVGKGFPSAPWDGDIFVFGKVAYRDLLSPSSRSAHETRWIGLYQLPTGESSDSIFSFQGIGVPDEYDRYS